MKANFTLRGRNPDILTCIANLSNDEVFTPPVVAGKMLDNLSVAWAVLGFGHIVFYCIFGGCGKSGGAGGRGYINVCVPSFRPSVCTSVHVLILHRTPSGRFYRFYIDVLGCM